MEKIAAPALQNKKPENEAKGPKMSPPPFALTATEDRSTEQPAQMYTGGGKEQAPPQTAPAGSWDQFAEQFNREFEPVLHAFHPDSAERYNQNNSLSGEEYSKLFTEKQRRALMEFMSSNDHPIPERLFIDDNIGNATAQQRLLISAHILANGKYMPGSFLQGIHARMCFHWLQIVHHYAGATTQGLDKGVAGNTDPMGNLVFAEGKAIDVLPDRRVPLSELPADESGDVGPIHAGTSHAETAAEKPDKAFRSRELPFSEFDTIQAGDWLYYYNANASLSGNHSVIFSGWAGPKKKDEAHNINYRDAWAYSQGSPSSGGRRHTVRLGDGFLSGDPTICPVTHITRVDPGTRPADSIEEYLPTKGPEKEAKLIGANAAFLSKFQDKNGSLDMDALKNAMRVENEKHIEFLRDRMTEGQFKMLSDANMGDNLELLIRLTQRLRTLVKNMEKLEANTQTTYETKPAEGDKGAKPGKNEQYEKIYQEFEAFEAEKLGKIEDVEQEMEPILEQIQEQEKLLGTFSNPSDEVQSAKSDYKAKNKAWKDMGGKPRAGTEKRETWEQLKSERNEALAHLTEVKEKDSAYRAETKTINRAIAKLNAKAAPYRRKIEKIEKEMTKAEKALPHGLVHPGHNRNDDKSTVTGKLSDIFSQGDLMRFRKLEE